MHEDRTSAEPAPPRAPNGALACKEPQEQEDETWEAFSPY